MNETTQIFSEFLGTAILVLLGGWCVCGCQSEKE